ncbi:carboxypeptidase regulatory-like domain-containing protein [Neobacillus sp. D3-1R]|uniref:carboxypeptidase regulatory-like domain-containing protein n=1 Tax=Neobacillus sp. D3-1R TaxID=3445778 RepID=UPI003F9EBEB5
MKKILSKKILSILLIVLLIGNGFTSFQLTAQAEKLVSSIQLSTSGKVVNHAFGDRSYDSDYYEKLSLQVTAAFSDGTSSNISNEAIKTSTDNGIEVSQDGTLTGNSDTSGYVTVTYQNKQATLFVNSNWDYVSGSYVLNVLSEPEYGDVTKTNVGFKDSNLEKVVREQLNKQAGTITEEDMKLLTTLDADYENIRDLTGMEFAVNLEDLHLEGNQINDLIPLRKLNNLKKIWLSHNDINNLEPLGGYTHLTELYAAENQISHLKGLEKLSNLQILDLHNNDIRNIDSLKGGASLSELNLNQNQITSITPLSKLTSLENVQLNHNQIPNLDALDHLSHLQWVDVKWNPLNAKSVKSIEELETKDVYVDFTDYNRTPIKFADSKLEQAISEVLNLSIPIKKGDLEDVQNLDLSNRGITNLKGLEYATSLHSIDLSSNFLKNIDVLLPLKELDWVEVSRNPLTADAMNTIQSLEDNGSYIEYHLNYDSTPVKFADANLENAISDFYEIPKPITKGDMSQFDYLTLTSKNISSLKGLENATNLNELSIWDNKLTSISELEQLEHLTSVDITRNPLDTNEGSEVSQVIKGLEARGITVSYDQGDSTSIDFADPKLEYRIKEILNIGTTITKGEFSQLESLYLNRYPSGEIIRLNGMEEAVSLKTLFLNDHLITDLSPLSGMEKLTELHLKNNEITDLSPLLALPNLQYLDVRNNFFEADLDSPARKILSSLEERGVKVEYNLRPDTMVKGYVLDETGSKPEKYSYLTINDEKNTYQTAWNPHGEFTLKLGDGSYHVTSYSTRVLENMEIISLNMDFEIKEGQLFVNGSPKETLEVKIPPISLKGNVLDENSNPVANASVTIESNTNRFEINTDSYGDFSSRLQDGAYSISHIWTGQEGIPLQISFEIKEGKLYVDGQLKDLLEIKLPPVTLRGSVLDENGIPVANANVQLESKNERYYTNTDDLGNFKFRLIDGVYRLTQVTMGNEGAPLDISFEIKEGKVYINGALKETLEIKLPPITLKGTLKDENGSLISNADISIDVNNRGYGVRTDSQGNFSFRLMDGMYRVSYLWKDNEGIQLHIPFEIKDGKLMINGEQRENLEVALQPITLIGSIVDENGTSVMNANVQVLDNKLWYNSNTDSKGHFTYRLVDGTYRISRVSVNNETVPLDIPFEIKDGKLYMNGELKEELDIQLPPVTLKGNLKDENGTQISNVDLFIDMNGQGYGVRTDSQGKFSFRLNDGMYRVTYLRNGEEGTPLDIPFEIKDGKLLINGEPRDNLEIKLQPQTLTGSLVDENGSPLSNAYIQVEGNNQWYNPNTDAQGHFTSRLVDGTYRISQASMDHETAPLDIPFEIKDGKLYIKGELKEKLDIQLPPVTLKGSLKDENEVLISNAEIFIEMNGRGYGVRTDSQGNFIYRLNDGMYRVSYLWKENEGIQLNIPFEIREGKLYVNEEQKESLDINLLPITLNGSLLDENGLPVANASVQIEGSDGWKVINTDSHGHFVYRLVDGFYKIKHVFIGNEGEFFDTPFEIKEGKLYVNGEPMEQLVINLLPIALQGTVVDENGVIVSNGVVYVQYENMEQQSNLDNQGNFKYRLADGEYNLTYIWMGKEGASINIPFQIVDGKLYVNGERKEKWDIQLLPVTFNGKLVDANGQPISNADVFIEINNRGYIARTDAQGNFSYRLPEGTFHITYIWKDQIGKPVYIPFEIKEGKLYVDGDLKEQLEVLYN